MTNLECILPAVRKIYSAYEKLWMVDKLQFEIGNQRLIFPNIKEVLLKEICKVATESFKNEPTLLRINKDCVILGDLHGHILDLFRVLKKFGPPRHTTYVILGDVVDRGEFSLETITLVLIMKLLYPNNVFLIRGNHEFHGMFQYNGFAKQLEDVYGSHILTYSFAQVFSYLPLGAIIQNKILCVHGGIGAGFTSIHQIENLQRPLIVYDTDPVMSIVWSDPDATLNVDFIESTRGIGYHFGKKALDTFMTHENLTLLVRGHEPCQEGFQSMFDGKIITIFGASNYCNKMNNKSAVLLVMNNGNKWSTQAFPPLPYIMRHQATFSCRDYGECHIVMPSKMQPMSLPVLQHLNVMKREEVPSARRSYGFQPKSTNSLRRRRYSQPPAEIFPIASPSSARDPKNIPPRKNTYNRVKKL